MATMNPMNIADTSIYGVSSTTKMDTNPIITKHDQEYVTSEKSSSQRAKLTETRLQEIHQWKMNIHLDDLKSKLRSEKLKELENQKESMVKKFDIELNAQMKKKNFEIAKLQSDLGKVQIDLRNCRESQESYGSLERKQKPMSGNLEKVSCELQESRLAKKALEESYQAVLEADKRKAYDLRKLNGEHKSDISRISRESHQEVRKLMDEMKSKDRVILHLEKELGYRSRGSCGRGSDSPNEQLISSTESITFEGDQGRYQNRITDLSRKLRRMEDQCSQLTEEKGEMAKRIKELERRIGPSQEKNRRFLHKNMDLTAVNRNLEDKLKRQGEENAKMKNQLEDIKRRMEGMMTSLSQEKQEKSSLKDVTRKYEQSLKDIAELQKGVELFKKECAEKDRRIDLLKHFQKQARETKVNGKEIEERRKLTTENRRLGEKLKGLDNEKMKLEQSVRLAQEQNENLEFRVLELSELIEKIEERGDISSTYTHEEEEDVRLSVLEILDLDVADLLTRLDVMKKRLRNSMNKEEKTTLLKAKAMIDIADKRLKASQNTERQLRDRVACLETEKDELLSHVTGVSSDCVLEYEENLTKLEDAQKKNDDLSKANENLQEKNKAALYQNEVTDKRLQNAQDEAEDLKRKVDSLHQGRDSEQSIMEEKVGRFREVQEKIADLEKKLATSEKEKQELKEQLSNKDGPDCKDLSVLMSMKRLKDRIAELEQDNSSLQNSELGKAVMQLKTAKDRVTELEWEKEKLDIEVEAQKKRNTELENINSEVTKNFAELRTSLNEAQTDVENMKRKVAKNSADNSDSVDGTVTDTKDLGKDNERLRNELFVAKEEIRQVNKELNSLEGSFVKINDENDQMRTQVDFLPKMRDEIDRLKTANNAKDYELEETKKKHEDVKNDLQKARKAYVLAAGELDEAKQQLEEYEKENPDKDTILGKKRGLKSQNNILGEEAMVQEEMPREESGLALSAFGDDLSDSGLVVETMTSENADNQHAGPGKVDSGLADDMADETLANERRMSPDQLVAEEKATLNLQIDELKTGKEELLKDIDVLKDKENRLKSDYENLEKEKQETDNKLDTAEKQLDDMMGEKTDMEKEKNTLNSKLNNLQNDLDDTKRQLSELDDKCQSLEMKNLDLTQLVSSSEEKESKLSNQISALDTEVKELRHKEEEIKKEMEDVKYDSYDKIGNLKEEISELKKNEERLSESLNEAEQTESELRQRVEEVESPNSEINVQLAKLKEQNYDMNEKADDLEARLQASNELLEENHNKHQDELKDIEDEVEDLHEQASLLKQKISTLEDRNEELDNDVINAKDKNDQLNTALQKAQARLNDFENSFADTDGVVKDLKEKLEASDNLVESLKKDVVEKDAVIEKHNSEIMEKEVKIQELKETEMVLQEKEDEIENLQEERTSDKKRLDDLKDKTDVLMESEDKLLDQVRDLESSQHQSRHSSVDLLENGDIKQKLELLKENESELEKDLADSRERENKLQEEIQTGDSLIQDLESRISELENQETELNDKVETLEKSEQNLMQELALAQLDSVTSDNDDLQSSKFKTRLNDSESMSSPIIKSNKAQENQSAPLEELFQASSAETAQSSAPLTLPPDSQSSKSLVDVHISSDDILQELKNGASTMKQSPAPDARSSEDSSRPGERTSPGDLESMTQAELIERVQQLESDRINKRERIKKLKKNLERMGGNSSKSDDDDVDGDLDEESIQRSELSPDHAAVVEKDAELGRLRDELAENKRNQDDEELLKRIEALRRSENDMDAKLATYDSQDMESLSRRLSDVSEDDLRKRVYELERMEKHLNSQISEMERDQDQMNEIARKDKDSIHELSVQVRELQSLIKNLKDQVVRMEATEGELVDQMDTMQTEVEDLEDQLNRVKRSEKRWKDEVRQLKEREGETTRKSVDLDDQLTDLSSKENKLKNNVKLLETENEQLRERMHKSQDKVYDLESNEIVDKQKLRDLEKRTRKLQSELASVVDRAISPNDLKSMNENLLRKLSSLENEKAGLNYEVTDLSIEIEELTKELALLQNNEQALKNQLDFFENNQKRFQKKAKDLEMSKLELMQQLDEAERENRRPVSPMPGQRIGGKDAEIETLSDDLDQSREKVKQLQKSIKSLTNQLHNAEADDVSVPRDHLARLENQSERLRVSEQRLQQAERTNANLMDSLKKIRSGRNYDDDSDLEVRDLQKQVDYLNSLLKEKQAARFAGELIVEDDMQDGDIIAIRRPRKKEDKGVQSEDELEGEFFISENSPGQESVIKPEAVKREQNRPDFSEAALDDLAATFNNIVDHPDSHLDSQMSPDPHQLANEETFSPSHQQKAETLPDFSALDNPQPEPRRQQPSRSPASERRSTARDSSKSPTTGQRTSPDAGRKTPMTSPEKQRRNRTREGDAGDSDSSIDEEPIAGYGRRESRLFDLPDPTDQSQSQNEPEPAPPQVIKRGKHPRQQDPQTPRYKVERAANPDCEDLTVSMTLSDESLPNSPRRDPAFQAPPAPIQEEFCAKRQTANYYAPENGINGSDVIDDSIMPGEARVSVPERRHHRPSDVSADDSGIHSQIHSQSNPDDTDRSSTPSRSRISDYDPAMGTPHLSPWLTHQLVDQKSSGTNTGPYKHRAQQKEWPVGPLRHIATDTEEMVREDGDENKRLRQIIADLQCDLKVKQRELETARYVQKGLEDKVKHAEDSFTWKAKVKDQERDLNNKDRLLRNVMDEDAEGNPETIEKLKSELDNSQTKLSEVVGDRSEIDSDNKAMKLQLERKDKDIMEKTDKVDELQRELKRTASSMKEAETIRMETEGKLRSSEMELERLNGADSRYQNLRDEHADMKNKNVDMEDSLHQLEKDKAERDQLRQVVDDLKKQLKEFDDVKSEKAEMVHKVDNMQKLLGRKLEEADEGRQKAEKSVSPLRAKIMRLGNKCRDKDEMIRRLVNEVRKPNADPSAGVVREAEEMKKTMAGEEYNRPLSPMGAGNSMEDELIKPTATSDQHASAFSLPNGNPYYNHNGHQESDIIPTRLGKVENQPQESRIPLPMDHLPPLSTRTQGLPNKQPKGPGIYQALANYDPAVQSTSSRPRMELPLKPGEMVKVLGPVDEEGYHEAEVKGRRGLVPSQFIQPVILNNQNTSPSHRRRDDHGYEALLPEASSAFSPRTSSINESDPFTSVLANVPLPADGCTEILPTTSIRNDNMSTKGSTLGRGDVAGRKSRSLDQRKPHHMGSLLNVKGVPSPPTDFHIARILSDRNVMVAWSPPPVDELDRSNGVQIIGYKISVDDIEKHKVSSPHLSKALIGRLDLHRPHKITIQSYCATGEVSASVHAYFEDILSDTRGSNSDFGSVLDELDLSSDTSMNVFKNNEPRTFMAVYDYNPADQSPNPLPNSELAFKTGDIILAYGRVRQDGFYNSKIRGKKGLVPASFIEAVPVSKQKPKRHSSRPGSNTNLSIIHHPTM